MIQKILIRIAILLAVFIGVNAIIWSPWLFERSEAGDIDFTKFNYNPALQVFSRIFPVRRGIFEGKVASFWCVVHHVTPWKVNFWSTREMQFRLTMGTTLVSCLPSLWLLFKAPSAKQFMLALFCNTMIFFLFAFQVHEK